MFHRMNSGKVVSTMAVAAATDAVKGKKTVAVKTEAEYSLEEAHGPLHKRSKSYVQEQQLMDEGFDYSGSASNYSPLEEPSPLGLRLRKSPSLLELIQMRLSQVSSSKAGAHGKKDHKGTGGSGATEKLKASNFPASILKIGTWEYKSRYEGDLVAKCYFAKHKLVWEVLDGGLKNKIEIQWSDIMGLKANYPDDGPGTLDIVLATQPLFYRETNPQPRKHTLWQATPDFTNGQASIHRRHYLQCSQGLLGKHFEKLVQCDPRLNYLSQQPEITLESLYFEPQISVFEEPGETNSSLEVHTVETPAPFSMLDVTSPSGVQPSSSKNEQDLFGRLRDSVPRENPSPSSVMDTRAIEERFGAEQCKDLRNWDIRVPGLHTSMSMSDLVSHLEQRISEKRTSHSFTLSPEERESLNMLEDISRCLLSDAHNMPTSDESSLMSRVNSLCCLLHKDPLSVRSMESGNDDNDDSVDLSMTDKRTYKLSSSPAYVNKVEENSSRRDSDYLSDCKQISSMSRKDSVGDLLHNLPRIASFPQFLFSMGDDYENQAR